MGFDSENAFPRFALAMASSEASFSGCDQPNGGERSGVVEQLIPIGCSELRAVSVLLVNRYSQSVTVSARVFGNDGRLLREMCDSLVPGEQWVDFRVDLSPLSGAKMGHFVRFQLELPEGAAWLGANPGPAFPETFCFRLSPPQPCFWPTNVLPQTSGSSRFTGVWKSDPEKPFPHWLEISWKDPLDLRGIELEFPNPAETPAHYQIEISALGGPPHAVEITNSDRQSATHRFDPPLPADRLRLTFFAARNAPSVSVGHVIPTFRTSRQE